MIDKKKVVHFTTVHHPLDPRIYFKQCLSLKKAGFDVTLIAPDAEKYIDESELNTISTKKYSNKFKRMIFGTLETYRQAKRLKADYYHFHDPELLLVGWLLKNKHNTVIYDIHEDYETGIQQKEYIPKGFRKFISKVFKGIEKFFSSKMKLIIAEKYYKEKYPNGYEILNYPVLNENIISSEATRSDSKKLLYTGNVTLERGAYHHVELLRLSPNIEVHLIGYCKKNLAEEILELAGENHNRLHLPGIDQYIPKTEIEDVYRNEDWLAGIAIFPPTDHYLKKELTKFFEYMMAGLPIICSNFPTWKTFVEKHQCGLTVDPDNENEIREAILYLQNNPQEAIKMGRNGREAVMKNLHWGIEENKLIRWYKNQFKEID